MLPAPPVLQPAIHYHHSLPASALILRPQKKNNNNSGNSPNEFMTIALQYIDFVRPQFATRSCLIPPSDRWPEALRRTSPAATHNHTP